MAHQSITLQELPDRMPAGERPRSIKVLCSGDLVDKCKPGDRVTIFGTFRMNIPDILHGFQSCIFPANIIANNIKPLVDDDVNSAMITHDDIRRCKTLAYSTPNIFDLLASSIAPSIFGFNEIKRGILCFLVGGNETIMDDTKMRLRGNIHILLIGDPSMGKSQFLGLVDINLEKFNVINSKLCHGCIAECR